MLRESTTQSSITLTQKQRFLVKLLLSSLHCRLATELPKQLQLSSSFLLESWPAGGRRAGAAEGGRGASWRRRRPMWSGGRRQAIWRPRDGPHSAVGAEVEPQWPAGIWAAGRAWRAATSSSRAWLQLQVTIGGFGIWERIHRLGKECACVRWWAFKGLSRSHICWAKQSK